MDYFALKPEVPGGLGHGTEMDTSVHPPTVTILHYEVQGWLGDDIIETFPVFLISPEASAALDTAGITGVRLDHAQITWGAQLDDASYDRSSHARVLGFHWLRPSGRPGSSDVAVDSTSTLIVSSRALHVLRQFSLERCDVSPWSPRLTATGLPPQSL